MKRIGMKRASAILGIGLGVGLCGLAIQQTYVTGQESRAKREVEMTAQMTSGKVKAFVKNDKGDVDGMSLDNGALIHFPPHLATSITRQVQVGDGIEVRGHEHTLPTGDAAIEAKQIEVNGQVITIEEPRRPRGPKPPRGPRHMAESSMTAKGKVSEFHVNRHGDVDGFLLSDGTEVKLPPHQAGDLEALVQVGSQVWIEGRRHETPHGDIHLHADQIMDTASGRTLERDEPNGKGHVPPHEEILKELRELRRLIEAKQQ
jgi:hypothetical protein